MKFVDGIKVKMAVKKAEMWIGIVKMLTKMSDYAIELTVKAMQKEIATIKPFVDDYNDYAEVLGIEKALQEIEP